MSLRIKNEEKQQNTTSFCFSVKLFDTAHGLEIGENAGKLSEKHKHVVVSNLAGLTDFGDVHLTWNPDCWTEDTKDVLHRKLVSSARISKESAFDQDELRNGVFWSLCQCEWHPVAKKSTGIDMRSVACF